MRSADLVLNIIRQRGENHQALEDVYRQMFNPALYILAYSRIATNQGAMTPGVDGTTVDGMSREVITTIIDHLRHERYQWDPARRVYIEKRSSKKMRPLGIPTWSDKLVQEVIRLILEAYYEPQFSTHSHGFRRQHGCNTALEQMHYHWKNVKWFIEGDIEGCFDTIDHTVLLSILAENIHDNRFLRLIAQGLKAGYLEKDIWCPTDRGTPQGGIASPILSNIYLDRLDRYVEDHILTTYNRGANRSNPAYDRARWSAYRYRKQGRWHEAKEARKVQQSLPSIDPHNPELRRTYYVRYADDFLLGFVGPKDEAIQIKQQLKAFLRETLHVNLSEEKTLITHGRTGMAHFLGYDVHTHQSDAKRRADGSRSINGCLGLRVPPDVIQEKCRRYLRHGKPAHRMERTNDSAFDILTHYQLEYCGMVNYYRRAYNLHQLGTLKFVMEQSLTKTLAQKLKISVNKVYKRYGTTIQTSDGPRKVLRCVIERDGKPPLVAHWGAVSLRWSPRARIQPPPRPLWNPKTELVQRLLADTCELCGSTDRVQVHHIRKLKDLNQPGRREKPQWVKVMAARQRKSMALCWSCHRGPGGVHGGQQRKRSTGEPDASKVCTSGSEGG